MAGCLMDTESVPSAGGMLPKHQLQPDTISPAQEALVNGWLTATEEYKAAGSNMQPPSAPLQYAASAARQGFPQPAEGPASSRPHAAIREAAYQQLSGTWSNQPMADVPTSEALEHPLEQGQTSLDFFDDMEQLFGAVYKDLTPPVHQQQPSNGPWVQSSTPLPMLPTMHPGATLLGHSLPGGSSGASDGLGAGCWLDSMPMQPHTDRLPALLTPRPFPYVQADSLQAALAEDSPDSAKSATVALGFFSRQALSAHGQNANQAAVCAHDAASWPLQSQVSNSSSVRISHASLQHAAFGTHGRQPWVQSQSVGQMLDSNAALLLSVGGELPSASGFRQKRKASEQTVGLDDLGSAVLEGMVRDLPTAPAVFGGSSGGSGGSAAHAGEQHLQLGGMAQVQALAQQLLPALPAAETQQPRKKQKTGPTSAQVQFQAGPQLQAHPYPPSPAQPPSPALPQARFPGKTRPQPYARRCPQCQPRRKAQPRSRAQPQVAAPPSHPAAFHATAPAAAPAATPAAAPTQEPGYQVGQVVWAKSQGFRWWPATVKQPDAKQARVTKIREGKVFVEYHSEGKEIDAICGEQIMQWDTMRLADKDKKGKLLKALQSAEQAIANGAVV